MSAKPRTLTVVYKDELPAQQFRKLVEGGRTTAMGDFAAGTEPITVSLVTAKTWESNPGLQNETDHVLFIGTQSRHGGLAQTMDVQFDEYGVRFGWAGNQAAIVADTNALFSRARYVDFLRKLDKLPVEVPAVLKQDGYTEAMQGSADKRSLPFLDALWVNTDGRPQYITDLKRRQQVFYGVIEFIETALPRFMRS